jgi:hypothetical protein
MIRVCEICGNAEELDEGLTIPKELSANKVLHICSNCREDRQNTVLNYLT